MKCNDCGDRFIDGEYNERTGLCWVCDAFAHPVAIKPVAVAPVAVERTGDTCRIAAMRAFFRAAKRAGLDIHNAEGMRAGLAQYLGCIVWSRRNLSVGQWLEATAGMECNLIAW